MVSRIRALEVGGELVFYAESVCSLELLMKLAWGTIDACSFHEEGIPTLKKFPLITVTEIFARWAWAVLHKA